LSSSASAGPIGCTSGLDAFEFEGLEFGVFAFGALTDFLGSLGFFAMARIWDESRRHKRAKAVVYKAGWNRSRYDQFRIPEVFLRLDKYLPVSADSG
jgi:hypothetical protein